MIRSWVHEDHDPQAVSLPPYDVSTIGNVRARRLQKHFVEGLLRNAVVDHARVGMTRDGDIPKPRNVPIKVIPRFRCHREIVIVFLSIRKSVMAPTCTENRRDIALSCPMPSDPLIAIKTRRLNPCLAINWPDRERHYRIGVASNSSSNFVTSSAFSCCTQWPAPSRRWQPIRLVQTTSRIGSRLPGV